MDVTCPKCGSSKVMLMDYGGLENNSTDLSQKSAYKCRACKQKFGTVSGKSIYSSIVRSISLSIDGTYANTDVISLKLSAIDQIIKYKLSSKKNDVEKRGTISKELWDEICRALFDEIYLLGWKSNYYNSDLFDGTTWSLNLALEKKHALSYRGCNGYPPYWNKLLSLLSPIFEEHGIDSQKFAV